MKTILWILTAILLAFGYEKAIALPMHCGDDGMRTTNYATQNQTEFRRLFRSELNQGSPFNTLRDPNIRNTAEVVITKEIFEAHLAVGNQRLFQYLTTPITMDIGTIDPNNTTTQTWVMPDLSNWELESEADVSHETLASSGFSDIYPEATHTIFWPKRNEYDFLELTNEDLFFYGFVAADGEGGGTVNDFFATLAPVPVENGAAFTGIVTVVYSEDPEYDSTQFIHYYDAVGEGTLQTYDDEVVEAIKLIFTEEIKSYKDGEVIEESIEDEIIWYSPAGHYLRVGINDPWNSEGEQELSYVKYQRLTNIVSSTSAPQVSEAASLYPNPAKQSFTLRSEVAMEFSLTDLTGKPLEVISVEKHRVNTIAVDHLSPGMYLLKSDSPEYQGALKLMVE